MQKVICVLLLIVLAALKDRKVLDYITLTLGAVITALLFAGYAAALSIDKTDIVNNWCGPSLVGICVVRSEMILPALISLFALAFPIAKIVRRALLRKRYAQVA